MRSQVPPSVLEHLKQDPLRNCNMLYFIDENPVTGLYTCGNSMLLKGISDREWIYVSSEDVNEFENLLSLLPPQSYNFAAVENWMIPYLQKKFSCRIELSTMKWYLPSEIIPPYPKTEIKPLNPQLSQYILDKSEYKEYLSRDYIIYRIKNGISGGIFSDEKLIAWAITHDDGAIGFLHVEEKYRRQGLGFELTNYMIERVRSSGRIPFVHIEITNEKSSFLALKTGFQRYGEISWLVGT